MTFAPIPEAIAAIGQGRVVVVVDDADRENEGDLVMAADRVTAEGLGFFVRWTSGIICCALTPDRCDELELRPMVTRNTERHSTAFTVSVDYRVGTTTGISASDRAATIRRLVDPATAPADLARPGHVFPLRARRGGVLERAGHTEAAVDLARLAGRVPGGVLCEIVNDDGSMARLPELVRFADAHGLLIIRIADLVRYRTARERAVSRLATARLPTPFGSFMCHSFRSLPDGSDHVALVMGDVSAGPPPLVRVHSECFTGDVLGSMRCDCGAQLRQSLALIAGESRGVLVYLRGQEGRGIGLGHKLRAYALQDAGLDTVDANLALGLPVDDREYGVGAQILRELGVRALRLVTNNPTKFRGLDGYGLRIVERVPLETVPTPDNVDYLRTKQLRLGHLLDLPDGPPPGAATARRPDGQDRVTLRAGELRTTPRSR